MSSLASCDVSGLQSPPQPAEKQGPPPNLKPCCACPETKQARDAWWVEEGLTFGDLAASIIEKGEENCGHLIEAHKECMRALGFKI